MTVTLINSTTTDVLFAATASANGADRADTTDVLIQTGQLPFVEVKVRVRILMLNDFRCRSGLILW